MRAVTKLAAGGRIRHLRRPDQVRAVGAIADGVVVGSAFVRVIEENAASRRTRAADSKLWPAQLASGLLSKNK